MFVISHLTEIAFKLSLSGFLGSKLKDQTKCEPEIKGRMSILIFRKVIIGSQCSSLQLILTTASGMFRNKRLV